MALQEGKGQFRMPHLADFDLGMQERAAAAVGLADNQLMEFAEAAKFLSSKKFKDDHVQEYIARLYDPKLLEGRPPGAPPLHMDYAPRAANVWEALARAPGATLPGSDGTWWGAFNAVTYMEDHLRESYKEPSNILHSMWFGGGARRKTQALELALEYAK